MFGDFTISFCNERAILEQRKCMGMWSRFQAIAALNRLARAMYCFKRCEFENVGVSFVKLKFGVVIHKDP